MRNPLQFCCAWIICGILHAFCTASFADTLSKSQIDQVLLPAIDGRWIQSAVIGVLAEGKTQVIGYGTVSPSDKSIPSGNTLYEIGSISKTFTSTLLARMVEQKQVTLDEPVQKLLPNSVTVPSTRAGPITLAHLATHRSGLPSLPDNFEPADPGNPYADYTVAQMYEFLSRYDLPRDPGSAASYSNLGGGLLGHALALGAGCDYETLLRRLICDPLQMGDTRIALNAGQRARLAPGFDADGSPQKNWDLPTLAGAGAIRSDVNDLLKYVSAELELAPPEFSSALKLTQQSQAPFDARDDIGLGWLIDKQRGIRWHNGQTGGYHCFAAFHPEKKIGIVVLSNTASGLIDAIGFNLIHQLLGDETKPLSLRQTVSVDPERLRKYVGDYRLNFLMSLNIQLDAAWLTAQMSAQPRFRIYPESERDFFWKVVDARLTFETDEKGQVTGLMLHQNGQDMHAVKK
jgi:CubicO group peptidase (beta-lactamase class C family)